MYVLFSGELKMLNETIRSLRKSFNISQVQMAKDLNVSKQCVSNWENDNILPSIEMLVKIAKYFDVSCDYLLGLSRSETIDVSGLTTEEVSHLKLLVGDLRKK